MENKQIRLYKQDGLWVLVALLPGGVRLVEFESFADAIDEVLTLAGAA